MKTDEIASIVLLIFAIIAGICTQWWVGLIIFVIGAVLIDKYIGFLKMRPLPTDRPGAITPALLPKPRSHGIFI